jgi:hypothetical protein
MTNKTFDLMEERDKAESDSEKAKANESKFLWIVKIINRYFTFFLINYYG